MTQDKIINYLPQIPKIGRSETDNKATIIDTETTGIGNNDEIIEFTAIHFYFNDEFQITDYDAPITLLNEPTFPIPAETTKYNGITNEMVKGHSIKMGQIDEILKDTLMVISHNAKFDRKYLEKDLHLEDKVWGCSLNDIDWQSKMFTARALDYLAFKYGFWFNAHRAEEDCFALLYLMTKDTNLEDIVSKAFDEQFRVNFEGTPFSDKDMLKENGCRWDADKRVWYLPPNIATNDLVVMIEEKLTAGSAVKEPIEVMDRYKTY